MALTIIYTRLVTLLSQATCSGHWCCRLKSTFTISSTLFRRIIPQPLTRLTTSKISFLYFEALSRMILTTLRESCVGLVPETFPSYLKPRILTFCRTCSLRMERQLNKGARDEYFCRVSERFHYPISTENRQSSSPILLILLGLFPKLITPNCLAWVISLETFISASNLAFLHYFSANLTLHTRTYSFEICNKKLYEENTMRVRLTVAHTIELSC